MADYTKTEWASGDVVTADKLNNIESGIASNASDIAANKAELESQAAKDEAHDAELASQAAKDAEHDTAISAIQTKLISTDNAITQLQETVAALGDGTSLDDVSEQLASLSETVTGIQNQVDGYETRIFTNEINIANNTSSIEQLQFADTTTNSEIELIKATLTTTANSVANIQNWSQTHATEYTSKIDELATADAEIKATMVTGVKYTESTGVLTLLGSNDSEIASVTISTAGTILKNAELIDGEKLKLTWQLEDESESSIEVDLSDLIDVYTAGTGITVDGNEISINTTWTDARYPVVAITTDNGRAFIQNERTGGGTYFQHTDGTNSFFGVNDGGADGLNGQIYSIDSSTRVGTRLNLYKKGLFYHPNKSSTDADYVMDDPNQEIAVKGDLESLVTTETFSTFEETLPSTFCIATVTSDTGSALIQNETTGGGPKYHHIDGTHSYVGVNNGGADGIGVQTYVKDNSTNVGTRINVYTKGAYYIPNKANTDVDYVADDPNQEIAVKGDIPDTSDLVTTTQLNTEIATLESMIPDTSSLVTQTELTTFEASLDDKYCIASIDTDVGVAQIQNTVNGSGPKFYHNDGTYCYMGVNNAGADGLGAQVAVVEFSQDGSGSRTGTRLNFFKKGAYYITGKSILDADYANDDPDCELVVKKDLTELQNTITESFTSQIETLTAQINSLTEQINTLSEQVAYITSNNNSQE